MKQVIKYDVVPADELPTTVKMYHVIHEGGYEGHLLFLNGKWLGESPHGKITHGTSFFYSLDKKKYFIERPDCNLIPNQPNT